LSPYEMAHRGFQDAVKAQRQLNETLEEEIKGIATACRRASCARRTNQT
jgi:hypothetical protein